MTHRTDPTHPAFQGVPEFSGSWTDQMTDWLHAVRGGLTYDEFTDFLEEYAFEVCWSWSDNSKPHAPKAVFRAMDLLPEDETTMLAIVDEWVANRQDVLA